MSRLVLALALVLAPGCHAKFKKNVDSLGEVRPQVIVTTGPSVTLGAMQDDSLVAAVVNVVQAVKSVDVANRLAKAVKVERVNAAFEESLVDTLGGGPPFGTTTDEGAALLQAEVVDYGLFVPALGAPGVFTYTLRVRIYRPDGERVYSATEQCTIGAGDPNAVSQALFTVNNVKQLEEMSDREITQAFVSAAEACGVDLVRRMRKHAG